MSVDEDGTGAGVGTSLLRRLLLALQSDGYQQVSLSVQKGTFAIRMYSKAGLETEEEYIVILHLHTDGLPGI